MAGTDEWVLLAYRLPRLPSTPRSTIWRKLRRLGVIQLADGLVALPADARTREQLEWIAEEVTDHDGDAMLWLARPADLAGNRHLIRQMTAAVAAEYDAVHAAAATTDGADDAARRRLVARLRRELHRGHRDRQGPPPQREAAWRAVDELAVTEIAKVGR